MVQISKEPEQSRNNFESGNNTQEVKKSPDKNIVFSRMPETKTIDLRE
jgi:hypothetical protein